MAKVTVPTPVRTTVKAARTQAPALEFGEPKIGSFNGKPTLNLQPDKERWAVTMGVSKLKVILEIQKARPGLIEAFVSSGGQSLT